MLSLLIMLSGFSIMVKSAPNCNSITIGNTSFPTGVCQFGGESSYSFECNEGIIYQNFYINNDDCSSFPMSLPACSMTDFGDLGVGSECVEVCDQGPCEYASYNNYADLECSTSIVASIPIILDHCQQGGSYSCNNGMVVNEWYLSSDCSGFPIFSIPMETDACMFGIQISGCSTAENFTPTPVVDNVTHTSNMTNISATFDDFIDITVTDTPNYNGLMCDGAVIGFGGFMEMALPAGICGGSNEGLGSSAIARCENGRPVLYNYSTSADCSGIPSEVVDGCESVITVWEMESDIEGTDIPIEFGFSLTCTPYCATVSSPCNVFMEREYFNVDGCDGDQPFGDKMYYDEHPEIIGYCSYNVIHGGAARYENNGTHIVQHFYSNPDCLGEPEDTQTYGVIGNVCEEDAFGNIIAKMISVGTTKDATKSETNGSGELSLDVIFVFIQMVMLL